MSTKLQSVFECTTLLRFFFLKSHYNFVEYVILGTVNYKQQLFSSIFSQADVHVTHVLDSIHFGSRLCIEAV